MRKPFFKKSHGTWFVEINRKQVSLGKDKDEAFKRYHSMMAGEAPVTGRTTVVELLDQFLAWTQANKAPATYKWYLHHVQNFATYIGKRKTVGEVKPIFVTRWLATLSGSGDSNRNGAGRAVSRAFNWARKQGLIAFSPIAGMEKPAAVARECYMTADQWNAVLKLVKESDPARDLLIFLRETGARPFEARIATADHFDRANSRLVYETRNSKGKRARRVIRLNQAAQAVVTKLSVKRPTGALFLNRKGKPWTATALNQCFAKLEKKLGFTFIPYLLRHTFCTDALLRGVDPITVSILMGHKDAKMVMQTYQHLVQQDDFLAKKLRQATGEEVA